MHYLKIFEYVICVKEEGTFSAAAKKLGIAQSSLSVAIQKLEDELGCLLFDRSTSPISVTKAGEIYISGIKETLLAHDQLIKRINDTYDLINASIIIGMAPTKSYFLTPNLYSELKKVYPDLEFTAVERQTKQLLPLLLDGKIDFLYTTDLDYNEDNFNVEKICSERMTLAVKKDSELSKRCKEAFSNGICDFSKLSDVAFISFEKEQILSKEMNKLFELNNFAPKTNIHVSSILSGIPLAKQGLGILFLPSCYSTYKEVSNYLDLYYFDEKIYCKDQIVLTRKKQYKTSQVKTAIEIIRKIEG